MDGLKLFAKNKKKLESFINTVKIYSDDVRMNFGPNKCACITLQRGKKIHENGIRLSNSETINDFEELAYKYLGLLEEDKLKSTETKNIVKAEYLRRVKKILKTNLNSGKITKGINASAVATLRYSAGCVKLNKEELENLDRKTRKLLTIYKTLHPRSNIARIYVPRKEGARGLISVEECVRTEEHSLSDYVKKLKNGRNKECLKIFELMKEKKP